MHSTSSSSSAAAQINSTATPALRALVQGSIDYAGLFPPAELELESALDNYHQYLRSNDAWMLNTFVLPVGKFAAAAPHFSKFDKQNPFRISALGPKSEDLADFENKLSATREAIRQLQSANQAGISVAQLEIAVPSDCSVKLLGAVQAAASELRLPVFCEASPAESERVIALLAQVNTVQYAPLGYKLRTGGVTADAFPASEQIACALVAAVRDHVPIKFTAGLHHPVRQFRDEVNGRMHGFLNVLGAGVLAAEHSWDETTTAQMLEDEDPRSFAFNEDTFIWRNWKITADMIRSHRGLVTSFGSCSFDEPRQDLRPLRLL